MTAERVYALRCDNLHCNTMLIDVRATSKPVAQHIAALHGWHTTRRTDYCPNHLPGDPNGN